MGIALFCAGVTFAIVFLTVFFIAGAAMRQTPDSAD